MASDRSAITEHMSFLICAISCRMTLKLIHNCSIICFCCSSSRLKIFQCMHIYIIHMQDNISHICYIYHMYIYKYTSMHIYTSTCQRVFGLLPGKHSLYWIPQLKTPEKFSWMVEGTGSQQVIQTWYSLFGELIICCMKRKGNGGNWKSPMHYHYQVFYPITS